MFEDVADWDTQICMNIRAVGFGEMLGETNFLLWSAVSQEPLNWGIPIAPCDVEFLGNKFFCFEAPCLRSLLTEESLLRRAM